MRPFLRIVVLFLGGLFLAVLAAAELSAEKPGPAETFRKANALYEEKNYSEAEALYRSVLAAGLQSGSVYFNLGNKSDHRQIKPILL